jgi:hypothetical protein
MRLQYPTLLVAGLALLLGAGTAPGQGAFVNLNFEHPVLPLASDGFGTVPITNALPRWAGYIDGIPQDRVGYNAISIGSAWITLLDSALGYQPFEGSYFVLLQPSFDGVNIPAVAQMGTVPSTAKSVRFK